MFGKNNFDEKLRRMKMQAKKDRFSIRKLAIGAASVLLGFSFMGAASQTAKADTLAAGQQETVVANKQVNAKDVANKPKLSTFSGLSAFLRGSSEEESSASEGSTASQASEASSASSSSASEASSSSQASESSQSSNASQASTGSTASQASQASSAGSEASAASTGSESSDGVQKIKTTHANDIVIHHLLVDADGNKTTTPVKGLGDEKGDTYIDGYVGDTKTISATDPEQVAPDGYKIVADQKSATWTFVKDQNKEITFYYTQVPTTQTDAAPSFAQQFNNKTTRYESPEKNTLYGDIPVGNGIRLRYFFGTTLTGSISGANGNTASCALPNYNLISVSTDSTGKVTENQINGGYAYFDDGTYYANIKLGINGDISTLSEPTSIRLWNITTTGSEGNTVGAKLTALWSADYSINDKSYTIDYTSVMESNGGLINYKTTARNVTGLVNNNHTIDAANNIKHAFFEWNVDTRFLNNDQVPLFYIGNNQGIYLEGTSANVINGVHHKYRLSFNFSGPIAPTGWAGTYYAYKYTDPHVFGPDLSTALGQKVPKGQKAPDAGALAFGDASLADVANENFGGGETLDSGMFTIWDRQDLSVGDSQDIGFQSSIVDEMASAPKLELDPNGEDYRGNEITIHGTVTEEDASLRDNLNYTYNIDGDSSTTHSWSGPKAADFVNNDAGFSFTVPAQPQLVDGKDHSITVTVTDANGTVATQTYALRAPAASMTVHHYWMMSNGDLTTDKVKPDTYVGGKAGQSVTVGLNDPDQAAPTGYHLVPGQSDFKQVMPASGIGEVAFYYTGNATHDADKNNIIVHHVLKDSGQLVPGMNDTSVNGIVGETGIVKASDQPAPPAGYSLVPNQADQEFTFQPTRTQEAYVYYIAIAAKQGSPIKVHQVTIPGSTPVQVPQFSGDKWGEILDGDLSHVKSVDWADPIAVNQANGILATSGNKSADIKVTFDDETTFLISGAPVQVVGATAGDGQEFDSSTTAISKDQRFTDSKGYADISALGGIGDVDHYTFSDSADGSTNMNINWSTTNGTGQKQGYVLVHYKDGTAQAVPITIKIKSQSEQSGEGDNKLSQSNPMVMHVGESISGQDKYVSEGNRDKYFKNTNNVSSIAWNKRPNVNQTGTNTTGSVTVGFSDGSSKVLTGITVDVVGAEPNANASANSMKPLDPNPSKYLSDDSVGKIKPFNPIYSYVDDKGNDIVDANGKPTSPTFDASQNDKNGKQTAHIKVNYDDGTSQIVDVPISVTSQKDQNKNNIKVNNGETNPIRTHVNADKNYGLNTSVTIPGLTEGTDYSLSWASAPDVTAANLTNGEKKAKYTVNITYKDNTSDTADVWVDVAGGQSSGVTTDFNVKDDAALTADKAKAALSTASTTAIGQLANGKNVKYSWASDADGTALNVDTSDSDGKTAYVIIDYGDGTKQAVAVNIHVKSQKEQHSGKIKVNNGETNPIRTHVNANQNYGLDTSVTIPGLTEGKDYSLSWVSAPDVTANHLTDGEKTAKYTVQVTYTKDNTTDTADVWVDVAGGQSSGVTTDFNVKDDAALTADKAKAALSTASTTAIGKLANGKNVKYSWASDADGTALNVDTSDSDGKTAYVIIDYGDGTKQAVAVNIHVKSQKEQHSGKIQVNNGETNPIRTHVNANQNYGLDTSVAIDGLTEGKDYTLSWLGDAPDVTDANLTDGEKTAKYTVQVTYTKDNTTDTADVWVDVAGGQSSGVTTDFNVKDDAALTADKAKAALSTASTTAIGKLANGKNVKYSWASDADGTALNVDTSDSDGKTAYVIIDYGDGTKQAVAVNIHVKSQKEQHSGKIQVNNGETNPIRTHVNANQNYGLDTSVAIDGLTEGTDYTLSWLGDAPDVTDANLTNGEKTAKYTVQVTYTKDNTTDTADVWVDVAGGQSSGVTTNFNVKDDAALTADKAKAALSTASTTAIGKLANGKNVKYSWASDADGTALNVDTSDSDGKTAYVIIDYGDGTKQAVAVNIHVKSQKEQHSGKIKVNNGETNPIRTHVNANQNYGLDTSVAIDGLTEGKDYTLSWLGDAPDVTDANLTDGEKTAKYTVQVTYTKDNTTDTADVWVDVAGGQSSGVTTDFNVKDDAALTADKAKAALSTASTTAIGKLANGKNVKYSWASDADGTALNVDTSDSDGKTAYVIIDYGDGTKQAVAVNIHVKSQKEQHSGKIKVNNGETNPIRTHVNANQNYGLDTSVAIDGLTEGKDYTLSWLGDAPDVTDANLTNGEKTAKYTVQVTYTKDNTTDTADVWVDVAGGQSSGVTTDFNVKDDAALTADKAKAALSTASTTAIGKLANGKNVKYSWASDADGTALNVDTSDSDGKTAYVIINYGDGTKQAVAVNIHVKSQKEQHSGKIQVNNGETNPIRTHVNADQNYGLDTSVTIPGLTEGKDYSLSWVSAPDVTANHLTDGEKTAKYTVQVTYTKDNTTDTADVWVDVAGGQSSGVTTNFNVKDDAALTADKAKAALSTASTTAIGKLANGKNVKYSWASDADGTALNVDTSDSDGKTAYVIIDYGDGTKQAVAVNIHVKSQKEQHSGKIKVNNGETNPIRTHVNANQNYGLDTSVAIDGLTEGKDYTLSWLGDAPDVTDANLTDGEKTAKYTVQVTYTKDNTTDTADVWVDVAGGQSSGVTTDFNVKDDAALTADKAKAALSTASTTAIGQLANGKNVKYSWASDADGTALNVDTSDSDGKTAYVIIDYGDGTKQAVAVNIHVKSQKEQHSGKIQVNNGETNPIRTHVNADQNYGLDTSVTIPGLTEGKDYSLSWVSAPDVTANHLTDGEKTAKYTVQVTYTKDNTTDTADVWVDVAGGQSSGVTTDFNVKDDAALTADKAKAALSTASTTAIGKLANGKNVKYSWASDADGTALNVDTSDSDGKTAYVIIDYGDGTKQAVAVNIHVKSQKEQHSGKIQVNNGETNPIRTHVNADQNYGLDTSVTIPGLTEGTDYSLSWVSAPDVTAANLINGEKTAKYTVQVTYTKDNTTDTADVWVNVAGASDKGKDYNKLNSEQPVPTDSDSLGNYLNTGTISDWSPTYSLVKADGTPATSPYYNTTWTSGSHESEDIYVKVMYHKPGSGITGAEDGFQIVKVTIGLRQPPTPVTPVVITPKGGMVFVKRGQRLTAIEAQRAISNHDELDKANANYSWVTPLPNTQMLGSKIGHVRVFYKGQTTIVMVTVMVTN